MADEDDQMWTPTPEFVALREAWLDVPFDGIVPVGAGAWLQPLVNAVSAIVDPDRKLRETDEAKRRGTIASLRSRHAWAVEQVRLATAHGMTDDLTKWKAIGDEAKRDTLDRFGVDL